MRRGQEVPGRGHTETDGCRVYQETVDQTMNESKRKWKGVKVKENHSVVQLGQRGLHRLEESPLDKRKISNKLNVTTATSMKIIIISEFGFTSYFEKYQ